MLQNEIYYKTINYVISVKFNMIRSAVSVHSPELPAVSLGSQCSFSAVFVNLIANSLLTHGSATRPRLRTELSNFWTG